VLAMMQLNRVPHTNRCPWLHPPGRNRSLTGQIFLLDRKDGIKESSRFLILPAIPSSPPPITRLPGQTISTRTCESIFYQQDHLFELFPNADVTRFRGAPSPLLRNFLWAPGPFYPSRPPRCQGRKVPSPFRTLPPA